MVAAPPPDASRGTRRRIANVVRGVGLIVAAAAALVVFGRVVGEHYPIRRWIFWVYLEVWGYVALFACAAFGAGHLAVSALGLRAVPLRERLVYTYAAGVLAFFELVFVGGLLGLLHEWFAVALPVGLIAVSARRVFRDYRKLGRHVAAVRARGVSARSPWTTPVTLFGALGVGLTYYAILSPRNIAFDSTFYHLGIAQQYATEHAIRPFAEGWLPGALPHLASVLYAWALALPGLDMFGRLECAAHVEFMLFVLTLASIPALVRSLVPRAPASASWAAMFLFPGLLVYDSSLTVAADHVAAFWAVPIWLAFRRAYRDLTPRSVVVLAVGLAGAILTKYQAIYVLAFPICALFAKATFVTAYRAVARVRKRALASSRALWQPLGALAAGAGAGLVLTAPHWLKNWVFYGDPLFPYLNKVFAPTRWVPETGRLFDDWTTSQSSKWVTEGPASTKLLEAAKAMFTFSFSPHDWPSFHGKVPLFGSLFTLSLLLLPFLKRTGRTWALSAATHLGVFIWFWTMHQDRYLQVLLPWMAAVVAATIALAFRSGFTGKVAVGGLVLFQVVWGLDAYLIPAHAMTRASPLTTTSELISMGYKKKYDERFRVAGALFDIGASDALPADARILLHENNPRLGLWRPVVADVAGWQFALRYELLKSPADLDDALRALPVTHILTRADKSRGMDCLGADLRFFDYVHQDATVVKRWGEMTLLALPTERPDATPRDSVAYLGCGRYYARGLHPLAALSLRDKQVLKPPPRRRADRPAGKDVDALLDVADFAVVDPKCKPKVDPAQLAAFVKVGVRGSEQLWARRRSPANSAAVPEPADPSGPTDPGDHLFDSE